MAATVDDFVFERLTALGVRRISGYPGSGNNGSVDDDPYIALWNSTLRAGSVSALAIRFDSTIASRTCEFGFEVLMSADEVGALRVSLPKTLERT